MTEQKATTTEVPSVAVERSGWRLAFALVGSFLLYAFVAIMGANQGPNGSFPAWLVWAGFCAAVWLVLAILQVRWWRAGRAKFWRPPYGVMAISFVVLSLIGIPTLLLPRWRRWLLRAAKPDDTAVV
jgi:hypothetical protein